MTAAERTVFFKLNGDDNKISVSHILNNVSGTLKDLLNVSTDQEVVVPIEQEVEKGDIEFLNKFVEESSKIFGDDLEKHSDDLSYWMTKIPEKKDELLEVAKDVDKDVLIRCANFGDYLMVYPFLVFSTYVLSENCQDLNLAGLRTYLNEEDDFDEDQRQIIAECPEFQNL